MHANISGTWASSDRNFDQTRVACPTKRHDERFVTEWPTLLYEWMFVFTSGSTCVTPKALHNIAQGKRDSRKANRAPPWVTVVANPAAEQFACHRSAGCRGRKSPRMISVSANRRRRSPIRARPMMDSIRYPGWRVARCACNAYPGLCCGTALRYRIIQPGKQSSSRSVLGLASSVSTILKACASTTEFEFRRSKLNKPQRLRITKGLGDPSPPGASQ